MKRFETIEKIPTWALCYIINGDPTGLSDEDIKMVDGFMQKWQVEIVSPLSQDGNASFSHYPAFGLPAEFCAMAMPPPTRSINANVFKRPEERTLLVVFFR